MVPNLRRPDKSREREQGDVRAAIEAESMKNSDPGGDMDPTQASPARTA